MNNSIYLNKLKSFYNSLQYFDIKDNYLIFTNNKTFILPLIHTDLSQINPDIFLAEPNEIFHFLQVNELLYKNALNEKEINYLHEFTNRYLKIKKDSNEGKDINNITLWCLELLFSKISQEEFINKPASIEISNIIDKDNKELESGLGTSVKLVLTKNGNENFELEEEFDSLKSLEKAGFTTLFLIIITIILTCLFIAYFIINH